MHPNRTPNVTCFRCGKTFFKQPSAITKRNYCSWECRKNQVEATCAYCGKSFSARVAHLRTGRGKCCSLECNIALRRSTPADTLIDRFWAKVIVPDDPDACWGWTAFTRERGYGQILVGTRCEPASRASWMIHFGAIPDGLFVLHKCDNPTCTNPRHLFLGTNIDNIKDMVNKRRNRYGEKAANATLTNDQVRLILNRLSMGESRTSIAAAFGVSYNVVYLIDRGKTWKHLPRPHDANPIDKQE